MTLTGCCGATDLHFTPARAEDDLRRYRRKGPTGTARRLLRLLREADVREGTVLDVGGGIGVLHHELLDAGFESAVHVEAASAYLDVAGKEAGRRGHGGRVTFVHGDFVDAAPGLAPADLVVLDRVICCYPDPEALVQAAAGKAGRYWAASFPRERWYTRLFVKWENARRARAGDAFRSYIHPAATIYSLLGKAGLVPLRSHRGVFWEEVVCGRRESARQRPIVSDSRPVA